MAIKLPLLYKYHKYNTYLYELLATNSFYCATHAELNDPFDLRFKVSQTFLEQIYNDKIIFDVDITEAFKFVESSLMYEQSPAPLKDRIIDKILSSNYYHQKFIEILTDKLVYRVVSFTSQKDDFDFKMWSHYTDSFKGVRMKFDFNEDLNFGPPDDLIQDVRYDNIQTVLYPEQLREALHNKLGIWFNEKEYRYIRRTGKKKHFNLNSLKEITFGFGLSNTEVFSIMRLAKNLNYKCGFYKLMNALDNLYTSEIYPIEDDYQGVVRIVHTDDGDTFLNEEGL